MAASLATAWLPWKLSARKAGTGSVAFAGTVEQQVHVEATLRRSEVQRHLPPHRGSAEGRALLVDLAVTGRVAFGVCRIRRSRSVPAARAVAWTSQSRALATLPPLSSTSGSGSV
jgi:hypothetical protein